SDAWNVVMKGREWDGPAASPTELASDSKRRSAGEAAMKPKTESDTALPMVIGVDIGKEVFHLIGFGGDGKIVFRRKIKRLGFAAVIEKVPPCIVGMEACLSAVIRN